MLGWKIFVHALRMIFGNFKQTLRISIGPSILGLLATALMFFVAISGSEESGDQLSDLVRKVTTRADVSLLFGEFVVIWVVTPWIAVAWHRFILLEEQPSGFFPAFHPERVVSYFIMSLVFSLVLFAVIFSSIFLSLWLLDGSLGYGILIVTIPASFFALLAFVRLSVMLPAVAIGKELSFSEAWSETRSATGGFLVLIILSIGVQTVVTFGLSLLSLIPVVQFILSFLMDVILVPLIAVSILTTLYGVFIEKRELT